MSGPRTLGLRLFLVAIAVVFVADHAHAQVDPVTTFIVEADSVAQAGGEARETISKAQGYYADRVNRAQGDANRFLSVLAEYGRAREVTRTRLYVETMERVLPKMKVVVLDGKSGRDGSKVTIVEK